MKPFINYQHFIDRSVRNSQPAENLGIQCDLLPERIHGELQLSREFLGHETRATVGLCSLLHDDPERVTVVVIVLCDSSNVKPVVSPMVMPRDLSRRKLPAGETFVRLLVDAWKGVVDMHDEELIARQFMLGFLAHCCLEWPDEADGEDNHREALPLSEDGLEFAKLAARAFK